MSINNDFFSNNESFDPHEKKTWEINEQIARQMFQAIPDQGPLMLIIDKNKNIWPSCSKDFTELNISTDTINDVCEKIDDGDEPVVSQIGDLSIVAAQLTTGKTHCGYVLLAFAQYSPEKTLANTDLIEMILNQTCLIAGLIEKNNLLYELQIKNLSLAAQCN